MQQWVLLSENPYLSLSNSGNKTQGIPERCCCKTDHGAPLLNTTAILMGKLHAWMAQRHIVFERGSWFQVTAVFSVILLCLASCGQSFLLPIHSVLLLKKCTSTELWAHHPNEQLHQSDNLPSIWDDALQVRRLYGHAAAQPFFSQLLTTSTTCERKAPPTAALHLAAMSDTRSLEEVFNIHSTSSSTNKQMPLSSLATLLHEANYTNHHVQQVFGILNPHHPQYHASAPIYARTVGLSQSLTSQLLPPAPTTSTQCLVGLCLLGWAYPHNVVERCLSTQLRTALMECGILQVQQQSQQETIVFSLVSLIPLSITPARTFFSGGSASSRVKKEQVTSTPSPLETTADSNRDHWFATDWHPDVLGTTRPCFGSNLEPVMYIGPDSLALVQLGIPSIVRTTQQEQNDNHHYHRELQEETSDKKPFHLVDICTGSGIQAIATVCHYFGQSTCLHPRPLQATLVDINPRALQCAEFNFHLNGLMCCNTNHRDDENTLALRLVLADVCEPDEPCQVRISSATVEENRSRHDDTTSMNWTTCPTLEDALFWQPGSWGKDSSIHFKGVYQIDALTANPPFVPSPPSEGAEDEDRTLSYGLFSTYRGRESSLSDKDNSPDTIVNSNGSSSGEEVRKAILQNLITPSLAPGGRVGIVSEFFWSKATPLTERLPFNSEWTVLLVVNQQTLDMCEYAKRRSFCNSEEDDGYRLWYYFLTEVLGYEESSPGFLFLERRLNEDIQNGKKDGGRQLLYEKQSLPRSKYGSLWTPSNPIAQDQVRNLLNDFFDW